MLEAGPSDWHPYIHLPAGFIKTFYNSSINWCYAQEPGAWTARAAHLFSPRQDAWRVEFDQRAYLQSRSASGFRHLGAIRQRGWGYADVLPYFKRLERRIGEGEAAYRGRDGNLIVTDMDWRHPLCEAFIAGAMQLGIPRNPDYNGAIQEGVAYAQRTIHKGRRVSAATAFLRPAMKRPNVEVRTRAHATAIVFDGKKAVGVRYAKGGRGGTIVEIRARKEVILAGGTYNSPQLLQLSGVGPAPLLQSLGIGVHHALAGVGEGLQDHYAPRAVARVKNIKTINEQVRGINLALEALKWGLWPRQRPRSLANAGLLLLAFRRDRGTLGSATDVHARELQGRRARTAGGRTGNDGGRLATAP